jgi:serine/threonine protein phosphatase PrpC
MEGIDDLMNPIATEKLKAAISELSMEVRDQAKEEPALKGMGATIVTALIKDSRGLVAHIGDSRAYLLRCNRLRRITKDHSVVQLLIDAGEIDADEAATHPARYQVTGCVGMEGDPLPEVTLLDLARGDRLLLCTDGLTGMLSDEEIQGYLQSNPNLNQVCRKLVDAANGAGGKDNITALVVTVGV